ncbi:MAG: DUF86 domain-containing protein [Oscillospiraceae bacterium]|nr:DUF86 domain-containing protein [Oscillospiraceae bacterium]
MRERDRDYIARIKEELLFIGKITSHINRDKFLSDETIQRASSMSLITLGECVNHLSDEFRERHSEIEWAQIIAIRNIAAHGYWSLNMKQLWQTIEEDVPILAEFFDAF